MQPPEGPPTCTALNFFPFGIPPPMSNTIFPSGVPRGTSTSPVLFTFPTKQKVFVPLLFSVPTLANQSAPFKIIRGMLERVSTLLRTVGLPKSPASVVRGRGRVFGIPLFPSMERVRAVDSPQTKAPAPKNISMSNSKPVPSISLPRSPHSLA
ncbi:hypothetical protein ES708_30288 [subsurface metagenome]